MKKAQTVRLRECGELQCGPISDDTPVVPRIKILGWQSKNRRQYLPESVTAEQYTDISVNLNHPDVPNKSRQVQERFGWFENVTKEGDGMYGDLHFNPELPYSRAFAWWAKNKPTKIGMSHDAVGQGTTKNGVFLVEKVISVKSVDLVADPASTTKGLFEAMDPELTPDPSVSGQGEDLDSLEAHISNAVTAICKDDKLDLKGKVKKIKAALKILEEPEEVEEKDEDVPPGKKSEDDEDDDLDESVRTLLAKEPGLKKLHEQLDVLKTKLALKERQELAGKLIAQAKLPAFAVTAVFLEQLSEARDEAALKKLIEDRKAVASIQRPLSSGPVPAGKGGAMDNKSFAKQLKEGR